MEPLLHIRVTALSLLGLVEYKMKTLHCCNIFGDRVKENPLQKIPF